MNAQSTTKAYTRILDIMLTDMADVYSAGKESGQCDKALVEQIRTSFMIMFKMDLMEATKCTDKVIEKYSRRINWPDKNTINEMAENFYNTDSAFKQSRMRSIQNAFAD